MKQTLLLIAACTLLGTSLLAQTRTRFEAGAGLGASFIIKNSNTPETFSARVLPHAGLAAIVPVKGRFSLKTGAYYEQKGWRAATSAFDSSGTQIASRSVMKLHALTIPLAVHFSIGRPGPVQYSVAAGMAYSFFLGGRQETTKDSYRNGQLLASTTASRAPYIALIPDSDKMEERVDGTAYFMFNPAARAEATITLRKRYALQLFGAYGLTELSTAAENAPLLQLRYFGFALAVVLP